MNLSRAFSGTFFLKMEVKVYLMFILFFLRPSVAHTEHMISPIRLIAPFAGEIKVINFSFKIIIIF